jgi:peptide/nickel transport system substrate-binding protein
MNGREARKWRFKSFLLSLLSNIILLQAILLAQSDPLPRLASGDAGASARDEGDWLIWASRVEPKTLNPISAENDVYCRWITRGNIFEPLLVYDFDTLKLKPCLAESYEVLPAVHSGQAGSGDGMEITFRLRNDIHFSDGAPVTADDVIFTYQTITNPMIDAANIASLYVDVAEAVRGTIQ